MIRATTVYVLLATALVAADDWTKLNNGPWSAREGLMAVSQGDYMYMTAGRDSNGVGFASDVWRSEAGVMWEPIQKNAFPDRAYHTMVSFKDCLYVMGGQNFSVYRNDVWQSCDGATTWTSLGNAAWPVRAGHATVVYNDTIIVAGGCFKNSKGKRDFYGDVWSSPDGKNWTQLKNEAVSWIARSGPRLVTFKNDLYIVAGERGFTANVQLNDIWKSTDGGSGWKMVTASAAFSGRSGHGAVVTPDGSQMQIVAGWPELHDFYTSIDGATFNKTSDTVWECSSKTCGKFDFWSLYHKGKLYTLGGSGASSTFGKLYAETWVQNNSKLFLP